MSSILTNTSAMVALQTLKGINGNLEKVQSEISTGKSVASAKDNAAVWAISKVMESDVKGFDSISDSLELGTSTVSVARQALTRYFDFYNRRRPHSTLDGNTPDTAYFDFSKPPLAAAA